jgi:hypothetical protein
VLSTRARIAMFALAACISAYAVGCSKASPRGATPGAQLGAAETSPAWSREALEIQERMVELRRRTSRASSATPDTTPWREVSAPAGARTLKNTTPGGLLLAVTSSQGWADMLGDAAWEQTLRVWADDKDAAVGVVLLWGFMDDAVAGHDFRISMRRVDAAWSVERIEDRYHCRRKVTAEGRCG